MGFHHQVQPLLQFVERWIIQDSPEAGLLRRVVIIYMADSRVDPSQTISIRGLEWMTVIPLCQEFVVLQCFLRTCWTPKNDSEMICRKVHWYLVDSQAEHKQRSRYKAYGIRIERVLWSSLNILVNSSLDTDIVISNIYMIVLFIQL